MRFYIVTILSEFTTILCFEYTIDIDVYLQSVAISKPLNPKSLNSLMIRFTSPALNTTFKTERRLGVTLKAAHLMYISAHGQLR